MIRVLTLEELAEYAPRLEKAGRQLGSSRPMHVTKFLEKWERFYLANVGQVFGYWHGTELGGTLGAVITEDLYDDSPIAIEVFVNVREEARMKLGWRNLIVAYKQWANERGATKIYLSRWASCQKIDSLYQKLGFEESEVHYRLREE